MQKILVFAPHPDDEVLGVGGTIKKHSLNGDKIRVVVLTEGVSAQYSDPKMLDVRRNACRNACQILGVDSIEFYDTPDTQMDKVGVLEIAKIVTAEVDKFLPDVVYTTHLSELHVDHRLTYEAVLVATRPHREHMGKIKILAYETGIIRAEGFRPEHYTDITDTMDIKIEAYKNYGSEIEEYPHPRSLEAIETLARYRGIEAGVKFAEGFILVRGFE